MSVLILLISKNGNLYPPCVHDPPVKFVRYVGHDMLIVKDRLELSNSTGLSLKAPLEQYQPDVQSPLGCDNPSILQYLPATNKISWQFTCVVNFISKLEKH